MQRQQPIRRRYRYAPQLCVAATVFLLFLSLAVLHNRLSSSPLRRALVFSSQREVTSPRLDPLFDDAENDAFDGGVDDRIDELDEFIDESDDMESKKKKKRSSVDDNVNDDFSNIYFEEREIPVANSRLLWDHLIGDARISFGKRERERNSPPGSWGKGFDFASIQKDEEDFVSVDFGSDDQILDDEIRLKLDSIRKIEDAFLINLHSPLREGWELWLEGKADFLRRDRMFRSNFDQLLPKNHPLLQDPEVPGTTFLTKGDKLIQKAILGEILKNPWPVEIAGSGRTEIKRVHRRRVLDLEINAVNKRYHDDQSWGYFPGLRDPKLSFSEFMDSFFSDEWCSLRVFMVWNSPSWTYGVRHLRGLESLLYHHRNACVVLFSETMELNFFDDFVKEGFRIAVVMPNLDELLKGTPCHVFASVWHEWKRTKFYPLHYSELIRLAAIFKYGGVYLDSDVIVLKSLHTLANFISIDDQVNGSPAFSGAIMSFKRNSSFIMECLMEFYLTYDDSNLRWNGADLITRVINRLREKSDKSTAHVDMLLKTEHAYFPISSKDITRFFAEASNESEKGIQDAFFNKILNSKWIAFHYWNSITSALVPEPNSLVGRLLNLYCIHSCQEVM